MTQPAVPPEDLSTDAADSAEHDDYQNIGEYPVVASINAALAAHPDGVGVDIDREYERDKYDVAVVVVNQVVELEVDGSGAVREDDRDGDDDDVRKVQEATVTAADAIRQALERHPEGVLDEIELDTDDGRLTWDIDLDDAGRNDLAELTLTAR